MRLAEAINALKLGERLTVERKDFGGIEVTVSVPTSLQSKANGSLTSYFLDKLISDVELADPALAVAIDISLTTLRSLPS